MPAGAAHAAGVPGPATAAVAQQPANVWHGLRGPFHFSRIQTADPAASHVGALLSDAQGEHATYLCVPITDGPAGVPPRALLLAVLWSSHPGHKGEESSGHQQGSIDTGIDSHTHSLVREKPQMHESFIFIYY